MLRGDPFVLFFSPAPACACPRPFCAVVACHAPWRSGNAVDRLPQCRPSGGGGGRASVFLGDERHWPNLFPGMGHVCASPLQRTRARDNYAPLCIVIYHGACVALWVTYRTDGSGRTELDSLGRPAHWTRGYPGMGAYATLPAFLPLPESNCGVVWHR